MGEFYGRVVVFDKSKNLVDFVFGKFYFFGLQVEKNNGAVLVPDFKIFGCQVLVKRNFLQPGIMNPFQLIFFIE